MKTYSDSPNFSIIMPGGCNAQCSFCFLNEFEAKKEIDRFNWAKNLVKTLTGLPPQFNQISLTGGEPLLSPRIRETLGILSTFKERYPKVVLTTNGTNLLELIDVVPMAVDHINISRHHYDQKKNVEIFGGSFMVLDKDISKAIDAYSKFGIDVSVNCVINNETPHEFISNYIGWARSIGLRAIRFRKESGNLAPTPAELNFNEYKTIEEGACPVCRSKQQLIGGMDVYWKNAILEPTSAVKDSVYEVMYHPDGECYVDWAGEVPLSKASKPEKMGDRHKRMLSDLLNSTSFTKEASEVHSSKGLYEYGGHGSCSGGH